MAGSTGLHATMRQAYVYDNTARRLDTAMPLSAPEKQPRKEDHDEARRRAANHKALQRAHSRNLLYTAAVVGVVAVMFFVCVEYLKLQAEVKTSSSMVASLEEQLNDMTVQNEETELNVNGNIDYDAILDVAVNELGMVYPSRKQVLQYASKESEYVKQYSDVPAAK